MAKAESDSGSARPVRVAVSTSFERDVHDPEAGVPIELGEVVTARLGGKAAVARILRGWTRKVTPAGRLLNGKICCKTVADACMSQVAGDRRLEHLAAGYRANPQRHLQRQVQN